MSHVTGGGIIGNTMRVIPKGLRISVDWTLWDRPAIFSLIQNRGQVPEYDMRKTFNLGIGLIFVVARQKTEEAIHILKQQNEIPYVIGEVVRN
jgi:phosphoribosylformylglycinamidine cyclo-ligase